MRTVPTTHSCTDELRLRQPSIASPRTSPAPSPTRSELRSPVMKAADACEMTRACYAMARVQNRSTGWLVTGQPARGCHVRLNTSVSVSVSVTVSGGARRFESPARRRRLQQAPQLAREQVVREVHHAQGGLEALSKARPARVSGRPVWAALLVRGSSPGTCLASARVRALCGIPAPSWGRAAHLPGSRRCALGSRSSARCYASRLCETHGRCGWPARPKRLIGRSGPHLGATPGIL